MQQAELLLHFEPVFPSEPPAHSTKPSLPLQGQHHAQPFETEKLLSFSSPNPPLFLLFVFEIAGPFEPTLMMMMMTTLFLSCLICFMILLFIKLFN
jgi:hypothetical protein